MEVKVGSFLAINLEEWFTLSNGFKTPKYKKKKKVSKKENGLKSKFGDSRQIARNLIC